MAAPVQHHDPVAAGPYVWQPIAFVQLTATQLGSAVGLPSLTDNVIAAVIQCEGTAGTDGVRWRDDGTAPTSTVGMLLNATKLSTTTVQPPPMVYTGNLNAIQFIAAGGSPALNITYYR